MREGISIREKRLNTWIWIVSIVVPLAVALLFGYKIPDAEPLYFLPPIYAGINGFTALLLILALVAIKNGKRGLHQRLMTGCIVLSALFLILYLAYHMTSDSTAFGGEGAIR